MTTLILIVHVMVSLALIFIVLLQTGKGAEMGAAFGGSNQTVFGSQGAATFLSKVTTAAAVLFMLTSLSLAVAASRRAGSVMDGTSPSPLPEEAAPVQPAPPPDLPALPVEPVVPAGEEAAAPPPDLPAAPTEPAAPEGGEAGAPAPPAPADEPGGTPPRATPAE